MNGYTHIPTPFFRPTHATIDLRALSENYKTIQGLLPQNAGILAMVKADAYGHGAVPVARQLVECGVSALGVATVEEGLELRNAGILLQILVMGGLMGMGSPASGMMVGANLTPVVHSVEVIDFLEAVAASAKMKMAIHLKIDSGMSRLGVRPEVLDKLLGHISHCRYLYVEGVMTHLASAADEIYTTCQIEVFYKCKKKIEGVLGKIPIWHAANSTAILKDEGILLNDASRVWVRPGIALYGATNGVKLPPNIKFRPVMGLESRIALLKHIPESTPVSYGCTYIARRPSYIAIVPIGYADGYPLSLSGKAEVLVHGKRLPVIGRITMDMIIVDVTDLEKVSVGDEVVLIGNQGDESILVDELATKAGTIAYEIFCGISKRIPRIYKNSA